MTLQEQIRSNEARTAFVVLLFIVLLLLAGGAAWLVGGDGLGLVALMVGGGYAIFAFLSSGSMVARATGARQVTREQAPELYHAVEVAAVAAGLDRVPDVYVVADQAPNAFAAGRTPETAYVAATTGLLELMDERELGAVMAHEIAHVRNRDVRLMSTAVVLVGALALISDVVLRATFYGASSRRGGHPALMLVGLVAVVLAPFAGMLLQASLSRRREFLADATAVEITGDADAMASALYKLGLDTHALQNVTHATAHLFIESPLRDHRGLASSFGGLFDTHPALEDRIAQLVEVGALPPGSYSLGG